jgi:hypothetical protein
MLTSQGGYIPVVALVVSTTGGWRRVRCVCAASYDVGGFAFTETCLLYVLAQYRPTTGTGEWMVNEAKLEAYNLSKEEVQAFCSKLPIPMSGTRHPAYL